MTSGTQPLTPQDLRAVAVCQKVILWCILAYFAAVFAQMAVPPEARMIPLLFYIAFVVVATVFVFKLALRIYSLPTGIILGILTLVPCIGLLVLLVVNRKATRTLNLYGHRVGFMGADLSGFKTEE